MPVFNLYSKRQKKARGAPQDVFVYDDIPHRLRVQVIHIWRDAMGDLGQFGAQPERVYNFINDALCREYGTFCLSDDAMDTPFEAVTAHLLKAKDVDVALNVIELSFKCIEVFTSKYQYQSYAHPKATPEQAIAELNARFLEHGVGYQYEAGQDGESGQLIRKDSEIIHAEVMKPALVFLADKMYQGANE